MAVIIMKSTIVVWHQYDDILYCCMAVIINYDIHYSCMTVIIMISFIIVCYHYDDIHY